MSMIGSGLRFAVEDALGSGNYVDLAEVVDVTPPSSKLGAPDVTGHASAGAAREYVAGMIEPGEAMVTLNWAPGSASDTLISAWLAAREIRGCQIIYGNAAVFAFAGLPTAWSPAKIMPEGVMQSAVTLKLSGQPGSSLPGVLDFSDPGQSGLLPLI